MQPSIHQECSLSKAPRVQLRIAGSSSPEQLKPCQFTEANWAASSKGSSGCGESMLGLSQDALADNGSLSSRPCICPVAKTC